MRSRDKAVPLPARSRSYYASCTRKLFERYGVSLLASNRIGTIEECQNLFANAGNESDRIETEQHCSHISLDTVEDAIAFGRVRSGAG